VTAAIGKSGKGPHWAECSGGDSVRIRMSGAESKAVITDVSTNVLHVKVRRRRYARSRASGYKRHAARLPFLPRQRRNLQIHRVQPVVQVFAECASEYRMPQDAFR
jgi:hypothetical protein